MMNYLGCRTCESSTLHWSVQSEMRAVSGRSMGSWDQQRSIKFQEPLGMFSGCTGMAPFDSSMTMWVKFFFSFHGISPEMIWAEKVKGDTTATWNRSHKEHNATERIDIARESRLCRLVRLYSNDFRCTPSRIKITYRSGRVPLQLWVTHDCCETETCEVWIPWTVYQHIGLAYK
jgi:hypothetical protein